MLAQDGPPLAPFREAQIDMEAVSIMPAQEYGATVGDAAVPPIGTVIEQAT